ncbi:hypothetical protein GCM10009000_051740 [Halobacterium noricense]|uniref:Uncharacterized protein n=2 Tax=Haladaptatus pallidirubidus TaxID=1008152 RepID=A0AAV3UDB3_9EURY
MGVVELDGETVTSAIKTEELARYCRIASQEGTASETEPTISNGDELPERNPPGDE